VAADARVNGGATAGGPAAVPFRRRSRDLQGQTALRSGATGTVGTTTHDEGDTMTVEPRPITVLGTGYLGATHAVCMAVLGHEVLALDTDEARLEALAAGTVPFHEPGLSELLRKALDSGRLRFTRDPAAVAAFGDVHFVCTGTPQLPGSPAADLSQVEGAVRALAPHLHRPCLVVGKSTVPVGTAQRLAGLLRTLAPAGDRAELAWNPEFLREGRAIEDTLQPSRLVFGVSSPSAERVLRETFRPVIEVGTPVVTTDLATAELVKVAANSFLATKISFVNAMAEVCEASGADVLDLVEALGHDDRIGRKFLRPGLGFGGGCLPKDIRAFTHRAEELGCGSAVSFLHDVDDINRRRRVRMVDLVREQAGGHLAGTRVCVLGAAFKPASDDVRDAPALEVARRLHSEEARVTVFDPQAMANARRTHPELGYADSVLEAATGADVVAVLTEWDHFRALDPRWLGRVVARPAVVDARHALDAEAWRSAGWSYRAPGRPAAAESGLDSPVADVSSASGRRVTATTSIQTGTRNCGAHSGPAHSSGATTAPNAVTAGGSAPDRRPSTEVAATARLAHSSPGTSSRWNPRSETSRTR
jgi:UDPglucose 6-dehydrogenase